MLTVEEYIKVRLAHRDGQSIRSLAETFHHSRRKIRQVLAEPAPRGYTRLKAPPAPKLGLFHARIDEILKLDEEAPVKQRHTAMQVYRRLVPEGYSGGYDQVRRYIGGQRRSSQQVFIPLSHDPGVRLEVDFGHIYVDFPEGRQQVAVFIATWSFSQFPFAMAMPTERTEAILAGITAALSFFECVPHELWCDNPRTLVTEIFKGRSRTLNVYLSALASHYRFAPLFCLPASGNEKPDVERTVFALQRRWATPVPKMKDFAELNAHLLACCQAERDRTVAGQTQSIGERFAQEKAKALALPALAFDPCIRQPARVDKYQTVAFDTNRYSVPRHLAFQNVTIKGYINSVQIVAGDQRVAEHPRCYGRAQQILTPEHYLASLARRPAALDHAGVFRHWQLPAVFTDLRSTLEQRHGPMPGAREYIRVLQLLAQHPAGRVAEAIAHSSPDAAHIRQRVEHLAAQAPCSGGPLPESPPMDIVRRLQIPLPDLRRFDSLLTQGESHDQRFPADAAQEQPQAVAAANV